MLLGDSGIQLHPGHKSNSQPLDLITYQLLHRANHDTASLGVVHKGRPQRRGEGRLAQMRTNADKDLIARGRPQLSVSLLISPTVTALAVLGGPLRTGTEPANTSSKGKLGSLYQRMALSHLAPAPCGLGSIVE